MKTKKMKTKLRRGDTVAIIAGKDSEIGEGKILSIDRNKNKVIVEGFNVMTKHQKPSRSNQTGGIVRVEAPIHISNVMYLHKGQRTRLGYKVEVTEKNGKHEVIKKRYAKCNGDIIDFARKYFECFNMEMRL
jgi:large subunit ribosomal protein L24